MCFEYQGSHHTVTLSIIPFALSSGSCRRELINRKVTQSIRILGAMFFIGNTHCIASAHKKAWCALFKSSRKDPESVLYSIRPVSTQEVVKIIRNCPFDIKAKDFATSDTACHRYDKTGIEGVVIF